MPATRSASAPEPSPAERLMRLVPEKVGAWKRHMLQRAAREDDGSAPATVEAEFRRANQRVQMSVSATGRPPPAAVTASRSGEDGSERSYPEGDAMVRETLRRIDGRAEVALMRADGIVVIASAIGVPAAELKALALGVKPAR